MGNLRRLIALLLLAIWLPATLHCEAEAAEIGWAIAACSQSDAHDHSHHPAVPENCTADSCATVEGSFTHGASSQIARAPVVYAIGFVALILVPALDVSLPPVSGVSEALAAPPDISRSWNFVMRAAPLPGAPSLS